eukprot:3924032-Pyramimonas_sp.AAC.1
MASRVRAVSVAPQCGPRPGDWHQMWKLSRAHAVTPVPPRRAPARGQRSRSSCRSSVAMMSIS